MDINHYFGSDVVSSNTGDLSTVDKVVQSQQRILRRLLTPVDGYVWHTNYGVGVPAYIGATSGELSKLKALIISGLALESSVAMSPAPEITLTTDSQELHCTIKYMDTDSNTYQILSFNTKGVI